MLEQPMIEKLVSMRLQGMADALKAQEQDSGVRELSFVERLSLISGSAMELARKPGAGAPTEERKAPSQRLYRGHRLQGRAGAGKDCHSRAGEGFTVDSEPREPFRSRPDWCGEELHRLRPGTEGVPRWILGVLHAGGIAVPGSGAGTRRRKLPQSARTF